VLFFLLGVCQWPVFFKKKIEQGNRLGAAPIPPKIRHLQKGKYIIKYTNGFS
jgi:hypothetical protein